MGVSHGAFGLLAGFFVYVGFAALANRRRAIQEQLPDGCFQLARSLRSGLSLPAALRETAGYVPVPLATLFTKLATAITLGESTGPAVQRVADDAAVTDFDIFAAVVATHAEKGGNLPVMLDRLAASTRDRNQFRGYFRSVTALGRMTAAFLALAAPAGALMYFLFQPELFSAFVRAPEGQTMILVRGGVGGSRAALARPLAPRERFPVKRVTDV